jgi:hypothetical protein
VGTKNNWRKRWGKYIGVLLIILLAGCVLYFIQFWYYLPLWKTYSDPAHDFSFNYPLNSVIYPRNRSSFEPSYFYLSIFLGIFKHERICNLSINSINIDTGGLIAKPSEIYNGVEWKVWKYVIYAPPYGSLYDKSSVVWSTARDRKIYSWQTDPNFESFCRPIVKTFRFSN